MVRSFVGGLELIVSLLKSSDREVFTFNGWLFEFGHCISVNGLLIQRNGSFALSTRNLLIVSLSKVVFEGCTPTGSGPLTFLGNSFAQIFGQIVSTIGQRCADLSLMGGTYGNTRNMIKEQIC